MKDDAIICDKCDNYIEHPSGLQSFCAAVRRDPTMDVEYFYARLYGEKNTCKCFRKIVSMIPQRSGMERCSCGSTNTEQISPGGYQPADASRKHQEIDTNGEFHCKKCNRTWWA